MEFSWNYENVMRGLAISTSRTSFSGMTFGAPVYSLMMVVDLKAAESLEIPILAYSKFNAIYHYGYDIETMDAKMVLPLNIVDRNKVCAGAETMLKYFNRAGSGRLIKCTTPKNEVYYGNSGLIMDKDFTPLMLSTITVYCNGSEPNYTIYFHPKVFINDTGIINKSLAKKGMAFYLSKKVDSWVDNGRNYKVKVEDPSKFIFKPKKPDINHCSSKDFNNVLKENIDEVLTQIAYDNRRHL